ncbi:hypothetical protein EMIT0P12_40187 [Pseudomonas sp. IT-P12]
MRREPGVKKEPLTCLYQGPQNGWARRLCGVSPM